MHSPSRLRTSEKYRRIRRKFGESKTRVELANSPASQSLDALLLEVRRENPDEPEFFQFFYGLIQSLRIPIVRQVSLFSVINALKEPERLVEFDVRWENEHGDERINRAWRCDYSSALGPCRGMLRLHPHINVSVIKFMGLQATVRNALLNMPMGGGSTGADFDTQMASDIDVMSFAKSFLTELRKIIAPRAYFDLLGELGCGVREQKILQEVHATLINSITREPFPIQLGKNWAAGMAAIDFSKRYLKLPSYDKKRCIISGSGDAALYVAKNLLAEGAQVLTLSDSIGFLYFEEGLTFAAWQRIADLRRQKVPLRNMVEEDGWLSTLKWFAGPVWDVCVQADYAWPCSMEGEIGDEAAKRLTKASKIKAIIEVAGMACTIGAIELFQKNDVLVVPSTAAGVGNIATVALKLAENTPLREYEHRLKVFTGFVHDQCKTVFDDFYPDLTFKAAVDVCGFVRIARAMYEQGAA